MFDLLRREKLRRSQATLNVPVVYSVIIETLLFILRCIILHPTEKTDGRRTFKVSAVNHRNNEIFIDLHVEFCLKEVNINDPLHAPTQHGAPGGPACL